MQELELYIHIPFCVKKCAYCDFLSGPSDDKMRQEYVDVLVQEIQDAGDKYGKQYQVSSIFIGGGTPSLLDESQIYAIFKTLHQVFLIQEQAEITIEANPGTVTTEKLVAWKQAGINRLSIGLQSTDNQELKSLGRIHTYEDFQETYRMARASGFSNINIDLMSAIPGQTKESLKQTLERVAELSPEHISAYSLIIEEGTPFYEIYGDKSAHGNVYDKGHSLPDEEAEREMYDMTSEILEFYGFTRYEISNYAKDGFACKHNQGYWERADYLGMGLGAASLMQHQRFHNTEEYTQYITGIRTKQDIREDVEILSASDEMEEFMFLGLRQVKGISIEIFRQVFRYNIFEIYGEILEKLEQENLITISEDRIALTSKGVDVSNAVFVEFMEPDVSGILK